MGKKKHHKIPSKPFTVEIIDLTHSEKNTTDQHHTILFSLQLDNHHTTMDLFDLDSSILCNIEILQEAQHLDEECSQLENTNQKQDIVYSQWAIALLLLALVQEQSKERRRTLYQNALSKLEQTTFCLMERSQVAIWVPPFTTHCR